MLVKQKKSTFEINCIEKNELRQSVHVILQQKVSDVVPCVLLNVGVDLKRMRR